MEKILSTFCMWAPAGYYSLGIPDTLISPSLMKWASGPAPLAEDFFPDVYANEPKLRRGILIYKHPKVETPYAIGTNFFFHAYIIYPSALQELDNDALRFVCLHDLSHILWSDGFRACLYAAAASAATAFAITHLKFSLPEKVQIALNLLPLFVSVITYYIIMIGAEARADAFAVRHASNSDLQGWERLLMGQIATNKVLHHSHGKIFSADGNIHNDYHPDLTTRLLKVRTELRRRDIAPLDDSAPLTPQVERIKAYYENLVRTSLHIA